MPPLRLLALGIILRAELLLGAIAATSFFGFFFFLLLSPWPTHSRRAGGGSGWGADNSPRGLRHTGLTAGLGRILLRCFTPLQP